MATGMVSPRRPPGGAPPPLADTGNLASSEMLGTLERVLEGVLEVAREGLVPVIMPDLAL